jgi:hypothetical protein
MRSPRRLVLLISLILLSGCLVSLLAQRPVNSNAFYQQLRGLLPTGDVVTVKDLTLKRDAATFDFHNGTFAFYGQVNGKVTGAVFKGDGHLHITPPTLEERHNLSLMMHTEEFDQDFDQVVLRFTDGTADELHKASTAKGEFDSEYTGTAQSLQEFARHQLHDNLDLRLLQDVLSPAPGGFFLAAIHCKKLPHLFFEFDPLGVSDLAPEEVALISWSVMDDAVTYPLAFHRASEYANGTASGNEHNAAYKILHEDLDVTIERSGFLTSIATVQVRAEQDGVAVVPLNLYPTLRVSRVDSEKGDSLDYVQERKEDDPDFGVVLARPLKKGETTSLKIAYGGKDAVINKGGGNYYPVARENWYPTSSQGLGDYSTYKMVFHVAKGLQLVATGTKMNEINEGKYATTEWTTETPLPVVGFSLGDFESKEAKIGTPLAGQLTIDAFANKERPDAVSSAAGGVVGTLETTPMLASELSQGEAAAEIYTNFFGPLPFPHIALTQQSACNYGQSWPMLVYLPICGFFDATQQHFLGLGGENLNKHMYWEVVTPHEVAHQWWGQTVGFRGYRDQWMSEGFADASASIFLQATRPKADDFLRFWKEERRILTEKNQFGFRPVDVGPVTMGIRLSSPKAGWNIYGDLVYPKGAYILHMIRMMMWTPKEGDALFKATMQDFVKTYQLQAATTEDFKAIVERHMSPQMDLERTHTMDWFFREYVDGTDLPAYHFEGDVAPNGDGWKLHFKLTQSGVDARFKNAVPLYLELADGHLIRLGMIAITGSNTVEQTVNLPKLAAPVRKVSINYYYDVLCTDN